MRTRTVVLTALLAVSVLAIFALDVATGPLIGLALLYLVPIAYAVVRVGRRQAVGIAIEAFVAWLVADIVWRPPDEVAYSIWNALTRLVIFCGLVFLLASLLEEREALRELEERRRRFLRLLERNLPEPLARAEEQIRRIERSAGALAPPQSFALLHRAIDDLQYLSRDFLILGQADIDKRPAQQVDLAETATQAMRYVDQQRIDVAGGTEHIVVVGDPERIEHAIAAMLRSVTRRTTGDVWLALRLRDGDACVDVATRSKGWVTSDEDEDDDLALARLVARMHGGRVTTRPGDATTTVTLALPAMASQAKG